MTYPRLQRPTPGVLPESAAEKERMDRLAARIAAEAPWRETLEAMSREELIELAVAGGWASKRLWSHLERLREKYLKHLRGRRKGGQNAHVDQHQAKALIHDAWAAEAAEAAEGKRFVAADFGRRMAKRYPVITDPRTIEGWVRDWKKERAGSEPGVPKPDGRPCPEIFLLLGYVPPSELRQKV